MRQQAINSFFRKMEAEQSHFYTHVSGSKYKPNIITTSTYALNQSFKRGMFTVTKFSFLSTLHLNIGLGFLSDMKFLPSFVAIICLFGFSNGKFVHIFFLICKHALLCNSATKTNHLNIEMVLQNKPRLKIWDWYVEYSFCDVVLNTDFILFFLKSSNDRYKL